MMRRRKLLRFAGTALIAWPLVTRAQQPTKIARIGFLAFGTAAASADRVEALRAGLRDLGHVEGKNLVIEFRWAGTVEQLQEAATDLVAMKVDVIFAPASTETEPARRATTAIPIVFAVHADPVGLGHVVSLPRPGGNITGLADPQPDLATRRLAIFKEALPHAKRFGVLWSATAPSHHPVLQALEPASQKLGVQLHMLSVAAAEDFEAALATMARERDDGVFILGSSLTSRSDPALLARLTVKHRLPTFFNVKQSVVAGGLMSYGSDHVDLMRRAAAYIGDVSLVIPNR